MTAVSYVGKPVAEAIDVRVREWAARLRSRGVDPTLVIVRVGERPDGIAYERSAARRAEGVDLSVRHLVLDADVSQDELLKAISRLNGDASVHGVLILRPLPPHLDEQLVCNALAPAKDVDGTTIASSGSTYTGERRGFAPCTAQATIELLDYYDVDVSGKRALVIGRSLVAGKPAAMMLLERDATVTIAHSHSTNIDSLARDSDIIIAAAGRAGMVDETFLREGQHVIDVGINVDADGTMHGDVDPKAASRICEGVTPVPGGVGSITTSVLCLHVVEAAQRLG